MEKDSVKSVQDNSSPDPFRWILACAFIAAGFWAGDVGNQHFFHIRSLGPEVKELWSSLVGALLGLGIPVVSLFWARRAAPKSRAYLYEIAFSPAFGASILASMNFYYGFLTFWSSSFFFLAFAIRSNLLFKKMTNRKIGEAVDPRTSEMARGFYRDAWLKLVAMGLVYWLMSKRATATNSSDFTIWTIILAAALLIMGVYALVGKRRIERSLLLPYVCFACVILTLVTWFIGR